MDRRILLNRILFIWALLKHHSDPIEDHSENPGNDELKTRKCNSNACLSYFPVNRSKRRHAWNIEEAKDHQRISVRRSESHGAKDATMLSIPDGVVILAMPKRTLQLETTTSLAAIPEMSATAICQ